MTRSQFPQVQIDYFRFGGGLNLDSPALSIAPGMLIDARNYEPVAAGGYRRMNGIEAFDGRPSPSAGYYWLLGITLTGAIAVGDTVTGVTSAATGVVLQVNSGELVLTKVSGTFVSGETLNVAAAPQATTTTAAERSSAITVALDATYRNLAADNYRADIAAVPGSGNILGIHQYNGVKYAFRANAGGTAVDMYKSTSSGWSQVVFGKEVSFTAASVAPAEGGTLTQGAVTAVVRRVVIQSGTLGAGTAAGRMIIDTVAGGNFAAGAFTGGMTGTCSGAQTAITLATGGRFEFVNYNFTGSTETFRMYGCDGANRAFEFDGTYFVPIVTGMTTDTPKFIAAHKNHLFLAFRGSLQFSSIGNPYTWTPPTGAAEIGMGETITGFLPIIGVNGSSSLMVTTRNSTSVLYGSSSSDFNLVSVTPDAGSVNYTIQNMGFPIALDDRGIRVLNTTQEFGNFSDATITQLIQSLINEKQGTAVASSIHRTKNVYRLYFSDGTGLSVGFLNRKLIGIVPFDYGIAATCATSGENTSGVEEAFIGSSTGMVYQVDKGTSFNGSAIEAWLRSAYNNQKSQLAKKSYKRVILEMDAEGSANFQMGYDLGFGTPNIEIAGRTTFAESGGGGYWDQFTWDTFTWDSQIVATPQTTISGTAENISLLIYSNNDYDDPWIVQGASIYYIPRRLSRGY